ncbi:DUF402 domain-containing protein [Anaerotignum sp. MB30-C6]|uniref:DUF402 domain-containing protein n=1 Tax=Anaerotignum sp. MB30-C6 TaxID=3070814 RepID=UPI0027DE9860|nr:DUF402 domain-containing protein [Anaerotignum sp. MB30-C6]WMI82172.1 DUF402 domain-containing protein [Anaerotignum sp. MB30-C6]
MSELKLYRRRFIPNETIYLKDDEILYHDDEVLITKWFVFRPKEEFDHGISCYYFKKGFKISKFLNEKNELVYYYCDIIETEYNKKDNAYIFHDLLADVIVFKSGFVKVLDLAELADCLESGIISEKNVNDALRRLDALLQIIYTNGFNELTRLLEIGE